MIKRIIIVLALMLTIGFATSKATCPAGFTEITVSMNIPGCVQPAEVTLCYRCPITMPGEVRLVQVLTNPNCVTPFNEICNAIENEVMSWSFIMNILCGNLPTTPCISGPTSTNTITYNTPMCWYAERILYFGQQMNAYKVCDDNASCKLTYWWCYENGVYVRNFISAVVSGTPTCTILADDVTPPTQVGQVTPCFKISSACD